MACGEFSDSAALERPDALWGGLIGAGVSVVQTDFTVRLREWLAGLPLGPIAEPFLGRCYYVSKPSGQLLGRNAI